MNITDNEKIEIAKGFVNQHKNNNVENWQFGNTGYYLKENEAYLKVFENLMNDVYGTVTSNETYTDDGDIDKHADNFRIEICRFDQKDGRAYEYEWDWIYDSLK